MASGTMRETVVSSPQPAITLQSGSTIDENQNTSRSDKKHDEESQSTKDESNHVVANSEDDKPNNESKATGNELSNDKRCTCSVCRATFSSRRDLERHMSYHRGRNQEDVVPAHPPLSHPCKTCHLTFPKEDELRDHAARCTPPKDVDCSNPAQDCLSSNTRTESNTSTNLSSPKSSESKCESVDSDETRSVIKSLRSARRHSRKDNKRKSDSDSETSPLANRRKVKALQNNNNDYSDNRFRCPVCEGDFASWNVLELHLENAHPDYQIKCDLCKLTFESYEYLSIHRMMTHSERDVSKPRKKIVYDSPRFRLDRKSLRNVPKVIGFQDINFIDFSSEKFPLIAKDICEKSLHLSKDEFSCECTHCGRGFPCDSALEIHAETCESNPERRASPKVEKKNKRKSTPKFHPQHSATSDSDDLDDLDVDVTTDRRRNAFFNSLHLRTAEKSSSLKSEEDYDEDDDVDDVDDDESDPRTDKYDPKSDLADIQSIISVTNIPGINVKDYGLQDGRGKLLHAGDEDEDDEDADDGDKPLNIHISNTNAGQTSPGSYSSLSLSSPNFSVLNLISPNYSGNDGIEEEAQDCFAAECRRMKLRGEFPCKLCTAIFPNLRALKGHNRVHISVANGTPNSPYRCNICAYSSLDKATLVRHMRSHNGDRPYECAMCNYAFTTKANCERHLRNRHSKMSRDEVKSSIIYHPSEDPINDTEYQKTSDVGKKSAEKPRDKPEFSLPMNLKINLSNLKEKSPKNEDLFQAEHQELIKNIKSEEESKKTTETARSEEGDSDKPEDWARYDENEQALDLRMNKDKDYETDSSDVPQDLSKKEDANEFNNNNNNVRDECDKSTSEINSDTGYLPPCYDQKPNLDVNALIKMYSTMYPTLNITQIHQIILTQLNFPGLLQKLHTAFPFPHHFLLSSPLFSNASNGFLPKAPHKDLLGLHLASGLDDKNHNMTMSEKLQFFQQQALAEIMFKREKDRLANDFYGKAADDVDKRNRINDYVKQSGGGGIIGGGVPPDSYLSESEKKTFGDIILTRREDERKEPIKQSNDAKAADNRNSSVKMVIKNGVLIPKQKQRRYRTERPFSCEHCSARFTLRSNMERHIKQQHPQYWTQKSRSNVGGGRRGGEAKSNPFARAEYDVIVPATDYLRQRYELSKPISVVTRDTLNTSGGEVKTWDAGRGSSETEETTKDEEETTKDDLVIDEGKETERMSVGGEEKPKTAVETGDGDDAGPNHPQDLASVSKMLDNAVTQTQAFQKYFQEGSRKEVQEEAGRDEGKRDDGDKSEEEEGLVAGSTSSDENRSESEATSRSSQKKKSAYSLAPNRVSCPYCFRKFPWTSSLRRHVLTHTGQKPFKCTHCPLLFTTKSNCDRHLLRKHGREALIASSGQTDNHDTTSAGGSIPPRPISQATPPSNGNAAPTSGASPASSVAVTNNSNNYTMRNVPERPYKCNQCPSSTFSTLSNLNKHLSSKHHGQYPRSESTPEASPESRFKNLNPQAPPNVTISPTFPISIPRNLSIIPQYGEGTKLGTPGKVGKGMPITVPTIRVHDLANKSNGDADEARFFRKRSSSDEMDGTERKRTSPDVARHISESPDRESQKPESVPVPASELPFKCHLCEYSFGERSEALDHIRCQHPNEFQLLLSKGALEANTDEERHQHDEADEVIDSTRGRFPDYANRKVMCAFCMRRFWSAEDLRRHMRTHTGERPFSCDVCQRRFTLKHSMLRHRKKHNAADEVLVGSDEDTHQHNHHNSFQVNHNNNISVAVAPIHGKPGLGDAGDEPPSHRTILHQTLTRCGDASKEVDLIRDEVLKSSK